MKLRMITSLVAATVAVIALYFIMTPLIGILIIPFAAIACWELCHAAHIKNKPMIVAATIVAAAVPPIWEHQVLQKLHLPFIPILLVYIFIMVILMLAEFEKTRFEHLLLALLAAFGPSLTMSCLIMIRDLLKAREGVNLEKNLAIYFIFFTLCCAWLTDTYAFFVGRSLGRHKLCPKISPKKTVEGAAGGVLLTVLTNVGLALLFNQFFLVHFKLNWLAVGLMSLPGCVAAIIGDLAASTFKRSFGIKDFGKLFPGHGGVMDRFDSLVYTAPMMFGLLQFEDSLGFNIFYQVMK